jgi:ribonuclease E
MPEPAPRRRSTIREPAPVSAASETPAAPAPQQQPVAAPAPVVSSTSEEPAAPKRGWWGRRILGDQ